MIRSLFLTIIACSIIGNTSKGQNLSWSTEKTVDVRAGNVRPRLALTRNNNPVIVWGNTADNSVYFSASSNAVFAPAVKLNPNGLSAYVADWTTPDIAAFGDTVYVVFKSIPQETGACYLVRSTNGGVSFSDTVRISAKTSAISWLPSVTLTSDGQPIVSYMEYDAAWKNPRYVVLRSTDLGQTFSTPVNATSFVGQEVCDCCPASLSAQGDNVFVIFRHYNKTTIRTIHISKSSDGGQSFTQAAKVDLTNTSSNQCQATGPTSLIWNDSIVTVWRGTKSGIQRTWVSAASVDSLKLGTHKTITASTLSSITENYPRISGDGNIIGIAYQQTKSLNADILFTYSTTGLAGLSIPDTVNLTKTNNQINVDLNYKAGNFHFVWQDNSTNSIVYRKADTGMTGVKERSTTNYMKVFPNPSSDYVQIQLSEKGGNIELIDLSGKIVKTFKADTENFNVDISDLSSGQYNVIYTGPKGKEVKQLIIK